MVAQVYRFFVRIPVICATKPGVGEISWSTETISPGFCACFFSVQYLRRLCLHCRRVHRKNKSTNANENTKLSRKAWYLTYVTRESSHQPFSATSEQHHVDKVPRGTRNKNPKITTRQQEGTQR